MKYKFQPLNWFWRQLRLSTFFCTLSVIFPLNEKQCFSANQNGAAEVKVEPITMSIATTTTKQEVAVKSENSVARLYMNKNYKVIKELSFTTKLNKAKLA